jgi:hypothetical protein
MEVEKLAKGEVGGPIAMITNYAHKKAQVLIYLGLFY